MKKQTTKQIFLLFIFTLAIFVLFNCRDNFSSQNPETDENEKIPATDYGIVRLHVTSIIDNISPRTIFPQEPVFSSYILAFTPETGQKPIENITIDETAIKEDIDLEAGRWLITAYGLVFFEGKEEIVAEGNERVDVKPSENINISITIRSKKQNGENGMFMWSINIPDDVKADFLTITLSEWNNETNRVINIQENINSHTGNLIISGSEICESGYYLLHVSVGTEKKQIFNFSVVHIREYEKTLYERTVMSNEFVPVVTINGSITISSVRINGVNLQPSSIELKEVWAYTHEGERVSFTGIDSSRNWQMRIVEPLEATDIYFSVIILANGYLLDVKINKTEHIYKDDISVNLIINTDLLELNGRLNIHATNNLLNSDWEIKAYNASSSVQLSSNQLIAKTDTTGRWTMLINAFAVPTEVYFSAEKIINGKKYKRINMGKRYISNADIGIISLNAYFIPPTQVWIKGNIFSDSNSRIMHHYNGCFNYTRNNNLTDQSPLFFNILANFESNITFPDWEQTSDTLINYNYSKIIKDNIGLLLYNDNEAIAWDAPITNRPAGQYNVKITLDFRNDEYFNEDAMPLIKVERINEVFINGGTFTMGSPISEDGRLGPSGISSEIQHSVQLSSFYMMAAEVTQEMYELLMPTPQYKQINLFKKHDYPVVNISWYNAVEFANKLSERDGITPVYTITGTGNNMSVTADWNALGWRLPTETEWEYAARAGSITAYTIFYNENNVILNQNGQIIINNLANYNGTVGHIVEVNSYYPNLWGLYNMHGNVWEFCWDWYGNYPTTFQQDPQGPVNGTSEINGTDTQAISSRNQRIIRGGSYYTPARYLRSAHRGIIGPNENTYNDIGFRLVRRDAFIQ